jgi:hypothetical protein
LKSFFGFVPDKKVKKMCLRQQWSRDGIVSAAPSTQGHLAQKDVT